jgi:hypothetical protein
MTSKLALVAANESKARLASRLGARVRLLRSVATRDCVLRNDLNLRRCTDLPSARTLVMVENIDSTERLDAAKLRFACAATARIKSLLFTETLLLCLQTYKNL